MGIENQFNRMPSAAPVAAEQSSAPYIKELLEGIDRKNVPFHALKLIKSDIDGLQDKGEQAVLEGLYDKKAAELWGGQLRGDSTTLPLTIEGTRPLSADALPIERYTRALEELKVFPFYDMTTRDILVREYEDRLKALGG